MPSMLCSWAGEPEFTDRLYMGGDTPVVQGASTTATLNSTALHYTALTPHLATLKLDLLLYLGQLYW